MSPNNTDIAHSFLFIAANSLSASACLIVFCGICITQRPFTTALRLILLLSASDFSTSFINLLALFIGTTTDSCQVIGFIVVLSAWTSLFCCSCISLLAIITIHGNSKTDVQALFTRIIIGCVLFALLVALLPIFHVTGLEYANIDNFCRTSFQSEGFTVQRIIVFVFFRGFGYILAISITILAYRRIYRFYKSIPDGFIKEYQINDIRLLSYPTAQLLMSLPNIVNLFLSIWIQAHEPWLMIIACWCSLAGFVNSLIYGVHFVQIRREEISISEEDLTTLSSCQAYNAECRLSYTTKYTTSEDGKTRIKRRSSLRRLEENSADNLSLRFELNRNLHIA